MTPSHSQLLELYVTITVKGHIILIASQKDVYNLQHSQKQFLVARRSQLGGSSTTICRTALRPAWTPPRKRSPLPKSPIIAGDRGAACYTYPQEPNLTSSPTPNFLAAPQFRFSKNMPAGNCLGCYKCCFLWRSADGKRAAGGRRETEAKRLRDREFEASAERAASWAGGYQAPAETHRQGRRRSISGIW